jgi:hypothetical protein
MDFNIEVDGFAILAIIGILGVALIAGGIVLYRGGARASVRAFGAASVAAGTVMWAIILVSTPMSSSTRGEWPPEGVPNVSGMCAQDVPDCEDTIVVPSGEGETGDEVDTEVLPPDVRFDDGALDDVPSVEPQVEVETLTPVQTVKEDEGQPVDTPTLEPGDAEAYGREVPIGTFDQDGDSEPSTGSGNAEGAPAPSGVAASSELQ